MEGGRALKRPGSHFIQKRKHCNNEERYSNSGHLPLCLHLCDQKQQSTDSQVLFKALPPSIFIFYFFIEV